MRVAMISAGIACLSLASRMCGDSILPGCYFEGDDGANNNSGGNSGGGAVTGGEGGTAAKTYSQADYDALIAERDAAKTELGTTKTKLTEFEQLQLTDAQRIEAERDAAKNGLTARETELRQERTERVVEREARKLNVVDEDAALRLLDQTKIKFDEAGKPTNVAELLAQLVKDKPYLVGVAGGGSAGNPGFGHGGSLTAQQQIDKEYSQRGGSTGGFRI